MNFRLTWSSVFERLTQLGYQPGVEFLGRSSILDTSIPLDKGQLSRIRYADSMFILDMLEWDRL